MVHNIRIVILVNSSIFSSGIHCLLEKVQIKVIGEAMQWDELFELIKTGHPDVILIDLPHNNEACVESLEKLKEQYAEIPVILIINEGCVKYLTEFINMGVTGFLYCDTPSESLIQAIECVTKGHEYFAEGILAAFKQNQPSGRNGQMAKYANHLLTPRELAVCKLFCQGLSYKEIARALFISPRTVETHKKNIFVKLKIKSTADLVKYAMQHHLI